MTEGYRKAALKLHSLSAPDRAWMLQRLPEQERAQLAALLRELQELGIKRDQRVADDMSQDDVRQALLQAGADVPDLAGALDLVCDAQPSEVAALLAPEPDVVAAAVLSAYPWPWRARLLADYGVERRQRISRALQQAPQLKPRLRAELVKMLAQRLTTHRIDNPGFEETVLRQAHAGAQRGGVLQGLRRWLP